MCPFLVTVGLGGVIVSGAQAAVLSITSFCSTREFYPFKCFHIAVRFELPKTLILFIFFVKRELFI